MELFLELNTTKYNKKVPKMCSKKVYIKININIY